MQCVHTVECLVCVESQMLRFPLLHSPASAIKWSPAQNLWEIQSEGERGDCN